MLHAYRLRSEYEGLDPATTISLPGGSDLPVGQLFAEAKDGVVVLDDTNPDQVPIAQTLAGYFAVKTAAVPEAARKAAEKAEKAAKTEQDNTDPGADAQNEG